MIVDKEALLEWKERALQQPDGKVALDLEADSLHRYHEKLCLIQYADSSYSCMIDPLSIEDMLPFSNWLKETTVWMHGADYDMSLFLQAWNTLPAMILDTQTAARLLGFRQFGLAALVEHFYNVKLSKSSQKADWGKRPLPQNMLDYALNDVNYMLDMAGKLTAALQAKGRYEWFLETCRHDMDRALERFKSGNPEPWRIQGCGKLNRRGLAALRELWQWRDAEASVWDKPSFMVCSNADLIRWSQELQNQSPVQPHPRFHSHRRARFIDAVQKFYLLDEDEYPQRIFAPRRQKCEQFDARLERLIAKRKAVAEKLDIEPSFIASRSILEAMADNEDNGKKALLNWQLEVLGYAPTAVAAL